MGLFSKKKKVEEPKKEAKVLPEPKETKAKKEAAPKKAAPKAKPAPKAEPKKDSKRVYHVAKREDGKWAVKFAGGDKVIKLFDTKVEAEEYTKKMAENQGGVMLVHNSKGKNKGRIQ